MSEDTISNKKEFLFLHQNDRNIYDMLKIIATMPMNNSLRFPLFNMLKEYEEKISDIAPELTEIEENFIRDDKTNLAIKSYMESTNFPYLIAKKTIDKFKKVMN